MIGPPQGARVYLACGVTDKAALFAGSEGGGETWAIATTLTRTAILNGVNPQAWLTDVPEWMVRGELRATELATLLPWAWRRRGNAATAAQTYRSGSRDASDTDTRGVRTTDTIRRRPPLGGVACSG